MDDRALSITMTKGNRVEIGVPAGQKEDIILDMALMCEGLCTVIRLAGNTGIKPDYESLRSCIKHLEMGFADETYKTFTIGKKLLKAKGKD